MKKGKSTKLSLFTKFMSILIGLLTVWLIIKRFERLKPNEFQEFIVTIYYLYFLFKNEKFLRADLNS